MVGTAILLVLLFLLASALMAYSMTRVLRWPMDGTPAHYGLQYKDVSFTSRGDGLALSGWYIPGEAQRGVIVLLHGGKSERSDPSVGILDLARRLTSRGYGTFLFDFRGHGRSGGDWTSLGYYESRDALGAIDYLVAEGVPKERIGLLGFSMGATVALKAASQEPGLAGVVADSAYPDLLKIIHQETRKRTSYPSFLLWGMDLMSRLIYGIRLGSVKAEEYVREVSFPVLYISGGEDPIVTKEQAQRLLRASPNSGSELWVVPKAGHVKAYMTAPQEYANKVTGYFDASMRRHLSAALGGSDAASVGDETYLPAS